MRRSIVIAPALVCALGSVELASAQASLDRFGFELRLGGGPSSHTAYELERAEARLHGARRAHQDALWKLDSALTRQAGVARELDSVEHRIADFRGSDQELRRLHEQLEAAQGDVARIEQDITSFQDLAADAQRSADAVRDAHFRRAEGTSLVIDARRRVQAAKQELDRASQWVLEQQLYLSVAWQREAGWREDVARRLADAELGGAPQDELETLRREQAAADARLEDMRRAALAREPTVRAAESRLAEARRVLDETLARAGRDLEYDPDFRRARDDVDRFTAQAAQAERARYEVRDQMGRLERDIDRLRQMQYTVDIRTLEHNAIALRCELESVARDVHAARQCLTIAEGALRDAQLAYDVAYEAHQRCIAEERKQVWLRIEHRDGPKHDRDQDHDADQHRNRSSGGGRNRGGDEYNGGDDRGRREAGEGQRSRAPEPDDRTATAPGGAPSTGSYRDRGERYERARAETGGRQPMDD